MLAQSDSMKQPVFALLSPSLPSLLEAYRGNRGVMGAVVTVRWSEV